jgi:hypothetical protein
MKHIEHYVNLNVLDLKLQKVWGVNVSSSFDISYFSKKQPLKQVHHGFPNWVLE